MTNVSTLQRRLDEAKQKNDERLAGLQSVEDARTAEIQRRQEIADQLLRDARSELAKTAGALLGEDLLPYAEKVEDISLDKFATFASDIEITLRVPGLHPIYVVFTHKEKPRPEWLLKGILIDVGPQAKRPMADLNEALVRATI